jgi:hypothetical protein
LRTLPDGKHQHYRSDANHHAKHSQTGAQSVHAQSPQRFSQNGSKIHVNEKNTENKKTVLIVPHHTVLIGLFSSA